MRLSKLSFAMGYIVTAGLPKGTWARKVGSLSHRELCPSYSPNGNWCQEKPLAVIV